MERRALYDWITRILLAVFFAFCTSVYMQNALSRFAALAGKEFDVAHLSQGLAIFAASVYTLMIAVLYIVRRRPVSGFPGLGPSLAALLGGFLGFALLLFKPRVDLPLPAQVVGSLLVLIGNALALYVLTHLGRSFSILPEGRALVTRGPYRFIRHPLYLAEAVATGGVLIGFLSWGALIVVAAQLAFQFARMSYEERVLTAHFPAYAGYARRTARLIPGLY